MPLFNKNKDKFTRDPNIGSSEGELEKAHVFMYI